jgi:hypothetical protein
VTPIQLLYDDDELVGIVGRGDPPPTRDELVDYLMNDLGVAAQDIDVILEQTRYWRWVPAPWSDRGGLMLTEAAGPGAGAWTGRRLVVEVAGPGGSL